MTLSLVKLSPSRKSSQTQTTIGQEPYQIGSVKPDLATTCEQRPPVNNGQFESPTTSLNLSFIRHICQTAAFSGPKGGRCTQV